MPRPSAERTRSKRWRSGSRSNKHHPIAHLEVCPLPAVCLVHTTGRPGPRPPAMAMKLTRCEQRWVDDVRSGRVHIHTSAKRPERRVTNKRRRLAEVWALHRMMKEHRFAQVYGGGDRLGPNLGTVASNARVEILGVGRSFGKAVEMERRALAAQAVGYDPVSYGPMSIGISSGRMTRRLGDR